MFEPSDHIVESKIREQSGSLDEKSVRELQSIAQASTGRRRKPRKSLSRAGQLHLIDDLSRKAGAGLGLLSGVAAFIAVTNSSASPLRATVWMILIFAALYVCTKLRRAYRQGDEIAARPLRWRANYTSALCVLSTAIGAGAILLAPNGVSTELAVQIIPPILGVLVAAGFFHVSHGPSALAVTLPGLLLATPAAFRAFGVGPLTLSTAIISAAGLAGIIYVSQRITAGAFEKFPRGERVKLERMELENVDETASAAAAEGKIAG